MDVSAEKRTLIAVLLIVIISIASYRLMPRQQPSPRVPAREEPAASVKGDSEETLVPASKPVAVEPSFEEQTLEFDTKLYRLSLTSVGASIRNFALKEYDDLGKRAKGAELIPEGRRASVVTVTTATGKYDMADHNFTVESVTPVSDSAAGKVVFAATLPDGNVLRRTYTFGGQDYVIKLSDVCSGEAEELKVRWAAGMRQTERGGRGYLDYFSATAMLGGMFKQWPLPGAMKTLRKGDPAKTADLEYSGRVDWGAVKTKYFLACFIPRRDARHFRVDTVPYGEQEGSSNLSVTLGTEGNVSEYDIYIGPLKYDRLRSFGLGLERAVYLGPGWVSGISRGILRILVWLHRFVRNYGVVIIIFSCIMMVVFYPLTLRSLRSMREMQKLQPKIEALRQKYKSEPQKMNAEMVNMYRKEGINPLGGCLPLLFQMPVFWALFAILRSMIELRGAQFLWIMDLSERDPFLILPILMAGSMYVQQRFTPTDPRQKAMAYMMPIVMLFVFWSLPAGLVLYWLTYNVLSVVQHYLVHKKGEEVKGAPA